MKYAFDPISVASVEDFSRTSLGVEIICDTSMGIPLLAEDKQLGDFLVSLKKSLAQSTDKQLLMFFVNERTTASEDESQSNKKVLDILGADPHKLLTVIEIESHPAIVINGTLENSRLQAKEGVGRARKVLGDFALGLFQRGLLKSSWHRQSDADARLPADYFLSFPKNKKTVAASYPFFHSQGVLNEEEYKALQSYEEYLKIYFEGLCYAKSPYAFWTVGSLMAFDLKAYELVRGVPNVAAGEDFYFLSKMSRVGEIEELNSGAIELVGRESNRVPFGTGAAVTKIVRGDLTYQPFSQAIFETLKKIIENLEELSRHKNFETFLLSCDDLSRDFFKTFQKRFESVLANQKNEKQLVKHFHEIFDGLQTFRWLRLQRGDKD